MDISVQYNGNSIVPVPLVNHEYQFIDYGTRWGNVAQITLNGYITGLSSNPTGDIANFTSIFTGQFGTLQVIETGSVAYSWSNCVIEDISFNKSPFFQGAVAPYSVKLHSYNVPSGVSEPANEYSFTLGEDGIVSINHKVSAKGIKNSTGAFYNAVNFVQAFTGRNPFAPYFIPSGYGVMLSVSETINRAEGFYSVSETYKYNTGSSQNYIETFTLNVSDILDNDFLTMDGNLKIQGSPVYNNFNQIEANLTGLNILNRIQNLGFSTGLLAPYTFNVSKDTGACILDMRGSYISGYSLQDIQGYFDYTVSFDYDEILPKETWKVDGQFVCKGPLDYKSQQLTAFKTANGNTWRNYLSGLIGSSPLFTTYHSGGNTMSLLGELSIQENSALADFKASLTITDGAERGGANPKYVVEVAPQRWNFELLPSANIEGHYVVQDPQMMNRGTVKVNISAQASGAGTLSDSIISGMIDQIQSIYLQTGFIVSTNIVTGLLDVSYSREWIGTDVQSSGLLFSKTVGSVSNTNYTRIPGYYFGY